MTIHLEEATEEALNDIKTDDDSSDFEDYVAADVEVSNHRTHRINQKQASERKESVTAGTQTNNGVISKEETVFEHIKPKGVENINFR